MALDMGTDNGVPDNRVLDDGIPDKDVSDGTGLAREDSAGWREWLGLAVLALPTFMLALDFTALHLALPHLSASLAPGGVQQLWILDIYGFMMAGFLVTMGSLGDRIGRRKLLLRGAFAFGICSVLAAYAASAEMLILARALLGIAGATLMPSTLSLIRHMFMRAEQRQFAIAVWLGAFSFGGAVGPLIGGLLLEWFWWGAVFLLGVPVMLLLLAAGPLLLPECRDDGGGRLDLASVFLSVAAMLTTIYGVKALSEGRGEAGGLLLMLLGAAIGYLFVRRQRRLKNPLVDLQLFAGRMFSGALIGLLTAALVLGGFVLYFAQYLQLVAGMTPLLAGLWMIPYAVSNMVGAFATPLLASRMNTSILIACGLAAASAGFMLVMWMNPGLASGLELMIAASVIITLGLSPLMVLSTELAVISVPPGKSGSASSLSETCSELGMAMGVALIGTAGSIVYRYRIESSALPQLSPDAAAGVRENLALAASIAEHLPDDVGAPLLETARHAFNAGMQTAAGISAVLLLGLAAAFLTVLRNTGRTP